MDQDMRAAINAMRNMVEDTTLGRMALSTTGNGATIRYLELARILGKMEGTIKAIG